MTQLQILEYMLRQYTRAYWWSWLFGKNYFSVNFGFCFFLRKMIQSGKILEDQETSTISLLYKVSKSYRINSEGYWWKIGDLKPRILAIKDTIWYLKTDQL